MHHLLAIVIVTAAVEVIVMEDVKVHVVPHVQENVLALVLVHANSLATKVVSRFKAELSGVAYV